MLTFGKLALENGLLLKLLLLLPLIPGILVLTAEELPLFIGPPGILFGGKILLRLPPDGPEKLLLGF